MPFLSSFSPDLIIRPCTTRLVLVPISVQAPPRIVRNDSGISSLDGETWCLRHQSRITGIRIATMGVLLRNTDLVSATPVMQSSAAPSVRTRSRKGRAKIASHAGLARGRRYDEQRTH